ncbi:MAG: hypothetical protein H5T85_04470, partial [Actinobacteria bacterium]|nr:hypothetical protein [Actinomycetota bacterium]
YFEPLLRGLGPGKYISIVSTEKEDDLTSGSLAGYVDYIRGDGYREYDGYSEYEGRDESYSNYESDNSTDTRNNTRYGYNGGQGVETWGSYDYQENYLDATTYKLSDNVLLVDGQLIIRNLELVGIEENEFYSGSALITGDQSLITIYIKCDLKEAPLVARLTSEGKYRIMVESL